MESDILDLIFQLEYEDYNETTYPGLNAQDAIQFLRGLEDTDRWYSENLSSTIHEIIDKYDETNARFQTTTVFDILAGIRFDSSVHDNRTYPGKGCERDLTTGLDLLQPFIDESLTDLDTNLIFADTPHQHLKTGYNQITNALFENGRQYGSVWRDTAVRYNNPFDPRLSFDGLCIPQRQMTRTVPIVLPKECPDTFNSYLNILNPSGFTKTYLEKYRMYLSGLRTESKQLLTSQLLSATKQRKETALAEKVDNKLQSDEDKVGNAPSFVGNECENIELWSQITATKMFWQEDDDTESADDRSTQSILCAVFSRSTEDQSYQTPQLDTRTDIPQRNAISSRQNISLQATTRLSQRPESLEPPSASVLPPSENKTVLSESVSECQAARDSSVHSLKRTLSAKQDGNFKDSRTVDNNIINESYIKRADDKKQPIYDCDLNGFVISEAGDLFTKKKDYPEMTENMSPVVANTKCSDSHFTAQTSMFWSHQQREHDTQKQQPQQQHQQEQQQYQQQQELLLLQQHQEYQNQQHLLLQQSQSQGQQHQENISWQTQKQQSQQQKQQIQEKNEQKGQTLLQQNKQQLKEIEVQMQQQMQKQVHNIVLQEPQKQKREDQQQQQQEKQKVPLQQNQTQQQALHQKQQQQKDDTYFQQQWQFHHQNNIKFSQSSARNCAQFQYGQCQEQWTDLAQDHEQTYGIDQSNFYGLDQHYLLLDQPQHFPCPQKTQCMSQSNPQPMYHTNVYYPNVQAQYVSSGYANFNESTVDPTSIGQQSTYQPAYNWQTNQGIYDGSQQNSYINPAYGNIYQPADTRDGVQYLNLNFVQQRRQQHSDVKLDDEVWYINGVPHRHAKSTQLNANQCDGHASNVAFMPQNYNWNAGPNYKNTSRHTLNSRQAAFCSNDGPCVITTGIGNYQAFQNTEPKQHEQVNLNNNSYLKKEVDTSYVDCCDETYYSGLDPVLESHSSSNESLCSSIRSDRSFEVSGISTGSSKAGYSCKSQDTWPDADDIGEEPVIEGGFYFDSFYSGIEDVNSNRHYSEFYCENADDTYTGNQVKNTREEKLGRHIKVLSGRTNPNKERLKPTRKSKSLRRSNLIKII